MRVLAVGNMYPPHHLGGYEVVWRAAMEHLRARGHEVRVLTTDFALDPPDASIPEGDYVRRTLPWYWRDHEFPRVWPPERRRIERANRAEFDAAVEELSPNVVSWWAMGGMSMSLLRRGRERKLPALGVVHDDWPTYAPKVGGRFDPSWVDLWSFNSGVQRRRVQKALPGARTRVDHPGIDPQLFVPAPSQDWAWRLLYCGRLDERKGVDLTISALADLPDATLRIVGGGDEAYARRLVALAADLGVDNRVSFDRLPRHELPAVYAASDAVLFPVRWQEPFGLVPLEAMAVGRPVIASGRGGSAEYLEDGVNSLIAESEALVPAIKRLADDSALRARLREGGLHTAAAHTEGGFTRAIEEAHLEVIAT